MQTTKNILKYSVWAGLFLVPFIPFLVPSGMFFPFISGKGFSFRILTEVVFGLFLMLAFVNAEYRPKLSWITKAVLFFTASIFIADLLSVNPSKSLWSNYERMEGFVLIFHLMLYYIVASTVFNTSKLWDYFFNVTIVASVLASFYGMLQIMGYLTINQGGVRVDATFGNATYFAIYLVFHIFLCLYMLIDSAKPKWLRWLYGIAAVFELIVLYFTATRGAILGLIGGLAITGIILIWKERENRVYRKIGFAVLGSIVVLVGLFISVRNTAFVHNSPVLVRFASLGPTEVKTQGRYFVWPMALKGFAEKPIFGWGQESFNYVFNKYYDPRMYAQEQWFDRTHDVFLDWLISGGIVGFGAYASMYVALFYYIWRKKSPFTLTERSVFTGMMAAYIFHNIFVFDNLISYIMFFSILGFVHSRAVEETVSEGVFYTKRFSQEVLCYMIAPAALVITLAGIYFINIPAISANSTLIQAMTPQKGGVDENLALFNKVFAYDSFGTPEATEQVVQIASQVSAANVSQVSKDAFYELAKKKVEERISETPHDARYLVFAGSFFNRFGRYDDAIKYLEKALIESPKKQTIYFEISSSYLGKGDQAKMAEYIKKGYDLEPNAPESQILYLISAIYTKNQGLIKTLMETLDQNRIISDNRVVQAFLSIGDYNSVIAILTARVQKDPNNLQSNIDLASLYANLGQKQKAIDIVKLMIEKHPEFKADGESAIKQLQTSK